MGLTSLASITVPTPTVRACFGTLDMSLSKKRALAVMVSWFRVLTRVRDTKLEPGSLKAICPSGPIPENAVWKSQKFSWSDTAEGKEQIEAEKSMTGAVYLNDEVKIILSYKMNLPPMKSSIPPASLIFSSYCWHSCSRLAALPSRI